MKQRQLGTGGPMVGAIGLGCMSFAGVFGETDEATSHACLDAAVEAGINFLDTANVYGMGRSETVIGTWLKKSKAKMVLATKVGIQRNPERPTNNEPAHIRSELEGSLKRLGVEYVDLYYLHRRDPLTPIEEAVGALADLVKEGKIGGYGLSEVAPYTLRRAHEVHPCMAVQSEYSLWTRAPELGMIQACEELGVAFVPFSPLARGVFGRTYPENFEPHDFRTNIPRFQGDNYIRNKAIVDNFRTYAAGKGYTTAELALAWLLAKGDNQIPIPATRTADHLGDWVAADCITLTADEIAEIESILPVGFAFGDRYSDEMAKTVERYS